MRNGSWVRGACYAASVWVAVAGWSTHGAFAKDEPVNPAPVAEILAEPTVLGLDLPVFRAGEPITAAQLNVIVTRLKAAEEKAVVLKNEKKTLEDKLKVVEDESKLNAQVLGDLEAELKRLRSQVMRAGRARR